MCSRGEYSKHSTMCCEKLVEGSTTRRPPSPQSRGQLACVRGVDEVRLTVLFPEGGGPGTNQVPKVFCSAQQRAPTRIFKVLQYVYGLVLLISHQRNTCGE